MRGISALPRRRCGAAAAVVAAATTWIIAVAAQEPARQATLPAVAAAASDVQKTVSTYCVTCHNERLKTGRLVLDRPELADVAAHADVWEKVIRKVRTGMMPPAGLPRPAAGERAAMLSSLVTTLDQ